MRNSMTNSIMTTRRSGFTLVELLVVIAIISMLAALTLPAIQSARESARRTECINNQRQVALAVLNYESGRKVYPGLTQKAGDVNHASWYYVIFPYVEQTNLYDELQGCKAIPPCAGFVGGHSLTNAVNEHGRKGVVIAAFKCPSVGDERNSSRVNIVASAGTSNAIVGELELASTLKSVDKGLIEVTDADGAFQYNTTYEAGNSKNSVFMDQYAHNGGGKTVSSEFISGKNGTSNTILASENEDAGHWYSTDEPNIGFCYGFIVENINGGGTEYTWDTPAGKDNSSDDLAKYAAPVGLPYWINSGKKYNKSLHRRARPSSPHAGVIVSSFCDGSTKTLADSIDKGVFKSAMKPDSTRVFSASDF